MSLMISFVLGALVAQIFHDKEKKLQKKEHNLYLESFRLEYKKIFDKQEIGRLLDMKNQQKEEISQRYNDQITFFEKQLTELEDLVFIKSSRYDKFQTYLISEADSDEKYKKKLQELRYTEKRMINKQAGFVNVSPTNNLNRDLNQIKNDNIKKLVLKSFYNQFYLIKLRIKDENKEEIEKLISQAFDDVNDLANVFGHNMHPKHLENKLIEVNLIYELKSRQKIRHDNKIKEKELQRNLDKAIEEYDKTLSDLSKAQEKLKTAKAASKKRCLDRVKRLENKLIECECAKNEAFRAISEFKSTSVDDEL